MVAMPGYDLSIIIKVNLEIIWIEYIRSKEIRLT